MSNANKPFELIATLADAFEAGYLEHEFEHRKIPHAFEPLSDTAFPGLFQPSRGFANIYAPAECREIIQELIRDFRERNFDDKDRQE